MNAPHPEEFLTLQEIYQAAKRKLPPGPWAYLIGGAETETTVKRNRHALDSIAFRPRVLRDVSRVDASGEFLGRKTRLPVMLAPIGGLESIVEGGAAAAARGAAAFGVPQMLSSVCKPGLEETAAAADTVRAFQLYVRGDDAWVDDFVNRARDNGFRRGTEVVKAIALGAKTVGLGRFTGLALAAAGPQGLVRALEILEDEIRICLGLLGVTSFAELKPAHVTTAPAVGMPDIFSAF